MPLRCLRGLRSTLNLKVMCHHPLSSQSAMLHPIDGDKPDDSPMINPAPSARKFIDLSSVSNEDRPGSTASNQPITGQKEASLDASEARHRDAPPQHTRRTIDLSDPIGSNADSTNARQNEKPPISTFASVLKNSSGDSQQSDLKCHLSRPSPSNLQKLMELAENDSTTDDEYSWQQVQRIYTKSSVKPCAFAKATRQLTRSLLYGHHRDTFQL